MPTPTSGGVPDHIAAARLEHDDLAAIALHDLRSPLGVILGYTQRMRFRLAQSETIDATTVRQHLEAIELAAQRLRAVMDELGDLMAVHSGQLLSLHLETIHMGALVREVGQMVAAAHGRATIRVHTPAAITLVADRVRLARALHNVLDNACKYSPPDRAVSVKVQRRGDWVWVRVRDRGVGIPAAEIPALGQPFYRASSARSVNGTGLGLAGAVAIVEQHGGHIVVESTLDRGTTVCIQMPAVPPHAEGVGSRRV